MFMIFCVAVRLRHSIFVFFEFVLLLSPPFISSLVLESGLRDRTHTEEYFILEWVSQVSHKCSKLTVQH